jgi:hypothetical protein
MSVREDMEEVFLLKSDYDFLLLSHSHLPGATEVVERRTKHVGENFANVANGRFSTRKRPAHISSVVSDEGKPLGIQLANGISDAIAANFGRIAQRAGIRVREVEACVRQSPRLLAAAADGCTPFVQWEAFCTVATIDYLFPCGFPYP